MLAVLGFAISTTLAPRIPESESSSVWKRADVGGSVTGVAALVLFNFAWHQRPVVAWTTVYTYLIMIIGILVFTVFALIEKRASRTLIPFGVLRIDFLFTLAYISAGCSTFGISVFYTLNPQGANAPSHICTNDALRHKLAICCGRIGLLLKNFCASTVMLTP